MSVVIKEMKYPESCAECALWMYDDQGAMCPFKEHKYISDGDWQPPSDTKKGEWCPLVELPVKHGRLIEADSLKETLDYYIREAGWDVKTNRVLGWVKDEFIDSERTVVEREGD